MDVNEDDFYNLSYSNSRIISQALSTENLTAAEGSTNKSLPSWS